MAGRVSIIGGILVVFGIAGAGIYLFAAGALSVSAFYGNTLPLSYLLLTWNIITYVLLVLAGIALVILDRKQNS